MAEFTTEPLTMLAAPRRGSANRQHVRMTVPDASTRALASSPGSAVLIAAGECTHSVAAGQRPVGAPDGIRTPPHPMNAKRPGACAHRPGAGQHNGGHGKYTRTERTRRPRTPARRVPGALLDARVRDGGRHTAASDDARHRGCGRTTAGPVELLTALLAMPDERPGSSEAGHVLALDDALRAVLHAMALQPCHPMR